MPEAESDREEIRDWKSVTKLDMLLAQCEADFSSKPDGQDDLYQLIQAVSKHVVDVDSHPEELAKKYNEIISSAKTDLLKTYAMYSTCTELVVRLSMTASTEIYWSGFL